MSDSRSYLTVELLSGILAEFRWPCAYSIEDDLPDGIIVSFPRSNFAFSEGPDGDVPVRFLSKDTGGHLGLQLCHALSVLVPRAGRSMAEITPGLVPTTWPFRSEENTRNGIRNACRILLTHLTRVIEGDFSWVEQYLKTRATKRPRG